MSKRELAVSRATGEALALLGSLVKRERIARRWTQEDLAGRIGVDARTLSAVERGSPSVSIGTVFNAAFMAGVNLFGLEGDDLALARRRGEETLALLPQRVRSTAARSTSWREAGDDNF